MDTTAEVERLAASSYVSLTTFKKSGTAVPTPVWVSSDGDRLYVWTQGDSGKVKRIRNNSHVLVAPSDSRGGLQGAAAEGVARVLEERDELARVQSLHRAKYGLQFALFDLGAKVFRRNRPLVGIEITLP
ncbi:MAG: PPOX class F420-dependent oxidoreductase [Candidatus Nanopelagicales bacterium]